MTAFCDDDYLIELRRRTRPKPRCRDNRYPGYRQIRACPTRSTSVGPLSSSFCAELRAVRLLCCEKAELHLESKSEVIEHTQPGRELLSTNVLSKVGQLYERLISGLSYSQHPYIYHLQTIPIKSPPRPPSHIVNKRFRHSIRFATCKIEIETIESSESSQNSITRTTILSRPICLELTTTLRLDRRPPLRPPTSRPP